ncbi:hypothetical protein [Alicyclobacillus sp. SO9]|uniref:PglD-related sugar-binding protein n=1 Tax=Alicyclobacillus sp. SO9 TaxID=2665646 RepID=UPI0018E7B031|nr:hypothetical protein [Alicyclobacillus sp. SO9]QQE78261.1 hypothetical protein GI364_20650 [Alicyclobacillus sp. SO9]
MDIGIFGSSGLAQEVADMCLEAGYANVVLVEKAGVVPDTLAHRTFPVISEEELHQLDTDGWDFVIAVGNPNIRRQIYERHPLLRYVNMVHPDTSFGRQQKAELRQCIGNIVLAGVRMTTHVHFGNFGLYNLNATVAHDCVIEDFVTVGPGANISGNVQLMEGAYVGTGSVVLQGKSCRDKMQIGRYSTVGAGAVVTKPVADFQTVKGVPAK